MDSAKQEVTIFVVDVNKQRDNDTYLGLLMFEAVDNDKRSTRGELPISLPKVSLLIIKMIILQQMRDVMNNA